MPSPSGEQFEIGFEDQRVVVVEMGGGVRSYSAGDRHVLDGYGDQEAATSGRGQVLIPWPNRLEDGRYEFGGTRYEVPINEPDTRCAIHGLVREVDWTAEEREAHRVVLRHDLDPQPGYPFALELRIEYALAEDGLRISTTAKNVGDDPCPYGAGTHPYLAVGLPTVDTAILHLPARTVLEADGRGLPVGSSAVEGTQFDFLEPRPIGETRLDHCFTDLERDDDGVVRVVLTSSESGVRVSLWADEAYRYLMLYTGDPRPDVNRRSLAVEPMTCPPNAFRSGEGLVTLEPGDSHAATWGLSPTIEMGE